MSIGLIGVALLLAACSGTAPPRALPPGKDGASAQRVVPGEYILNVPASLESEAIKEIYARHGVAMVRSLGGRQFLIRLTEDPGLDAVRRMALDSGKIEMVSPNFVYRYQR